VPQAIWIKCATERHASTSVRQNHCFSDRTAIYHLFTLLFLSCAVNKSVLDGRDEWPGWSGLILNSFAYLMTQITLLPRLLLQDLKLPLRTFSSWQSSNFPAGTMGFLHCCTLSLRKIAHKCNGHYYLCFGQTIDRVHHRWWHQRRLRDNCCFAIHTSDASPQDSSNIISYRHHQLYLSSVIQVLGHLCVNDSGLCGQSSCPWRNRSVPVGALVGGRQALAQS
jgi:hypothetical protein